MSNTVENICYEYSRDVLFSQKESPAGEPLKIIAYIEGKYLGELSRFLHNHKYSLFSVKNFGKHYILARFVLPSEIDGMIIKNLTDEESS